LLATHCLSHATAHVSAKKYARSIINIHWLLKFAAVLGYNGYMSKNKKKTSSSNTIALNKQARHNFFIEDRFEAGIALQGWEVKSLRAGRIQIVDAHVFLKNGEAFISNLLITPLITASTHIHPEATRVRKLLLHRSEINKLIGAVERKGYTMVPTALYWKHGRVKAEIGLAKGKQQHDKRAAEKDRDWKRDKQRIMKGR
jgi:SsrA-binding protein